MNAGFIVAPVGAARLHRQHAARVRSGEEQWRPRRSPRRVVALAGEASKPARVETEVEVVPGVTGTLSALESKSENGPVVVLLGWHGSTAKSLRVYTRLYHGMDLATLSLTAPFLTTFNPFGSFGPQKRLSRAIRQLLLTRPELQGRKVIFHGFSNAGVNLVRWMGEGEKDGSALPPRLCGAVIYDSAPCPLTLSMGVRAVLLGLGKRVNLILKAMVYAMFIWGLFAFRVTGLGRSLDSGFWRDLTKLEYPKRELFIFSDADELMDADRVNTLVDARVKRRSSKLVQRLRFRDSPHVGHFMVHRKEYRAAIAQLVQEV